MSESTLVGLALITTIVGMGLCALTIDVHWKQLAGAKPATQAQRLALRIAGGLLFALAFWICTRANPVSMAVLVWTMLLTVSAATIAVLFTVLGRRRPAMKRPAKG